MSFIHRNAEIVRIDQRLDCWGRRDRWLGIALDLLFNGDDVRFVDPESGRSCLIHHRDIPESRPAWPTIWRALKAAGISVPRNPG